MFAVEHLSKSYGRNHVLVDAGWTVVPGTACVVIGPSGAGKSTLIRCASLLEDPDAGTIVLDELEYKFPSPSRRVDLPWPLLTVVFQQHFLWPHLTLYENIALPLRERMSRRQIGETVDELTNLFDMSRFIRRYPNEASVGQQQRVALARALALRPKYILLDEVTSALDVEQIVKLLDHLTKLMERGIGIVIVTHLLGFARAILKQSTQSHFVFLENGRVSAAGNLATLDAPPPGRLRDFVAKMQLAG